MPEKNGKLHPNHNIPPFNFKKVNEFSRPLERKKVVLDCESAIYNWRLKKFDDLYACSYAACMSSRKMSQCSNSGEF